MDTPFPNFGKVEYFCESVSTHGWRVLPVGQRNIWLICPIARRLGMVHARALPSAIP
jgi:hypothetical protein